MSINQTKEMLETTDNSYVYADVVKTFGDDIKTPWQWNVGARWSF